MTAKEVKLSQMTVNQSVSKHNFNAFLLHAFFLALAQSFMDVDTIIPSMLIAAGGNSVQIGILISIMLGGASFTQLFFLPYLQNKTLKKKYLLFGINLRIASLLGLSLLLFLSVSLNEETRIMFIFILVSIFSFSGAFSNISYTDILGKSIDPDSRKSFFSIKQILTGSGVFVSAFFARKVLASHPFPESYTLMLLIAAAFLGFASIGFWRIKETVASGFKITGFTAFFKAVQRELKFNSKLKYYLFFVNTLGICVSIFPFLILFAKENFHINSSDVGSFLVFKVSGVVVTGILLFFLSKRIKYRYLLYSTVLLTLLIPLFVMSLNDSFGFLVIFFIGGIVYSLYTISISGILLEISGTQNRVLYAGIAGAGNVVPMLFPILAGWIINAYGFNTFFVIFMTIISSSLIFIYKLHCSK
jgi:MFS family permease